MDQHLESTGAGGLRGFARERRVRKNGQCQSGIQGQDGVGCERTVAAIVYNDGGAGRRAGKVRRFRWSGPFCAGLLDGSRGGPGQTGGGRCLRGLRLGGVHWLLVFRLVEQRLIVLDIQPDNGKAFPRDFYGILPGNGDGHRDFSLKLRKGGGEQFPRCGGLDFLPRERPEGIGTPAYGAFLPIVPGDLLQIREIGNVRQCREEGLREFVAGGRIFVTFGAAHDPHHGKRPIKHRKTQFRPAALRGVRALQRDLLQRHAVGQRRDEVFRRDGGGNPCLEGVLIPFRPGIMTRYRFIAFEAFRRQMTSPAQVLNVLGHGIGGGHQIQWK